MMKKMIKTAENAFHEAGRNIGTILLLAGIPWLAALMAEPFFLLVRGNEVQSLAADLVEHGCFFTAVWGCGLLFPTLCYVLGELNEAFSSGTDLLDDVCIEEEAVTERCGHVGIFSVSSAMIGLVVCTVVEKELASLGTVMGQAAGIAALAGFLVLCILTADRICLSLSGRKELKRLPEAA